MLCSKLMLSTLSNTGKWFLMELSTSIELTIRLSLSVLFGSTLTLRGIIMKAAVLHGFLLTLTFHVKLFVTCFASKCHSFLWTYFTAIVEHIELWFNYVQSECMVTLSK